MKKEIMSNLMFHNIDNNIISQLIKIEEKTKIDLTYTFEEYDGNEIDELGYISIDNYRKLKELLNPAFSPKNNLFICKNFFEGFDVFPILEKKMDEKKTTFLIECERDNINSEEPVDLSILYDDKYDYSDCKKILKDIKDGIDVKVYLESDLPKKQIALLRYALQSGVNIENDLKNFKFLKKQKDIDDLINLRKSFDDYEKVLKKTKDCKITKLILEHNQKFDIDLLPYYQKNISIDVLTFISSCLLKKENMTPYKKIFNLSKESFPLYKKIYENVKDFNKYKNLGINTLKLINEAIDSNLEGKFGKIDIDKCIESYNNFNFYDPLKFMFICYKYKQEKLIEDLNPLMKDFYAFRMNEENLEKLIKYNYENENKIDIPSVIYNFESLDIETKEIIDLYTLYITKNIATQEIIDKLKPLNFNSNETRIILDAYNEGYDIDVMLNPNLRDVDLDAIYKCMVMGFKLEKDTELNLTKKEERSPETSRKRTLYGYYDDNYEYFEIR